jgi:hypothetical protein
VPALTAIAATCLFFSILMVFVVAMKWILIGRYRPGTYPLWSFYYFRWWLVHQLLDCVPTSWLRGTALLTWFYRALGTQIDSNCHVGYIDFDFDFDFDFFVCLFVCLFCFWFVFECVIHISIVSRQNQYD